jgi:putative pyoverdin transport system ATP-binding/permease protein
MRMLTLLLKESRTWVIMCGLFSLGAGGTNGLLLIIISEVIASRSYFSKPYMAAFFGMVIISQVLRYATNVTITKLVEGLTVKTRLIILNGLRSCQLEGFERTGHPKIHNVLNGDCAAISRFIPDMIELITAAVTIFICMVYLLYLSRLIFFLAILVMAIGASLYLLRQHSAKTTLEQSRLQLDKNYKFVLDFLHGFKELKMNPRKGDGLFNNHIIPGFHNTRELLIKASKIVQLNYSLGLGLFYSLLGLVLFYLPHQFPGDGALISKTAIVLLYMVIPGGQFFYSALQFVNLEVAVANLENLKIETMLKKEPLPPHPLTPDAFENFSTIRFMGIGYSYYSENEKPLFSVGPLDVDIIRGNVVFITGGNGNGKTTLCKMITGLYAPQEGQIWVDDIPVSHENAEGYRGLFSAVFSDFYLFDKLYGIEELSQDRIDMWLERFDLSHKLTIDNGVFSTNALSSGQRRRLALFCALMEQRPVLVCDELTADQEPGFREYFYKEFIPEMKQKGKTIIIITHDDRYFHLADQMVKLDYGSKVEEIKSF